MRDGIYHHRAGDRIGLMLISAIAGNTEWTGVVAPLRRNRASATRDNAGRAVKKAPISPPLLVWNKIKERSTVEWLRCENVWKFATFRFQFQQRPFCQGANDTFEKKNNANKTD